MEKNKKLIAGLMIALLAVGVLAIAPTVFAEDEPESSVDPQQFSGWKHRRQIRRHWLRYILKNGEYAQLTGTVIAQKVPILVLATGEDATINVILPPLWLVGGEVLNRTDVFDGDPFSIGSTITLDTLKANYTKDTYEITVYFTYCISGDGVEAKALLPFNIEATSW